MFTRSPSELNLNTPPPLLSTDVKNLLPSPSIVIEDILGIPAPIVRFILAELSSKNNIFAGTSPLPDPGGSGLEKEI